jgi:hypothetical protein
MSKRLQVLLDEAEYREVRKLARAEKLTVAAWVRQALRMARRAQPTGNVERKLAAIEAAARHDFPTGDISQMLDEIEKGYLSRDAR